MTVEYQDDYEAPDIFIKKDDVNACSDIRVLTNWFNDLEETADTLIGQIESRISTETCDDDWLIRVGDKLSFTRRGQAVVRRRLRELDVDVYCGDSEKKFLKKKLSELKVQVTRDGFFNRAAREILDKETLREIGIKSREFLLDKLEKVRGENERYIETLKGDLT